MRGSNAVRISPTAQFWGKENRLQKAVVVWWTSVADPREGTSVAYLREGRALQIPGRGQALRIPVVAAGLVQ